MKSFKQYIKEKWIAATSPKDTRFKEGQIFDIYKNPSPSEYKKILASAESPTYKEVRGIVTKEGKGDIYLWNAQLLHAPALMRLVSEKELPDAYKGIIRIQVFPQHGRIALYDFGKMKNADTNMGENKNVRFAFKGQKLTVMGNLIEKFVDFQKMSGNRHLFSIFKNPSPREMEDAANDGDYTDIRGWVDRHGKGDLYVFNSDLEHHYAMKNSKLSANDNPVPIWLFPKSGSVELSIYSISEYLGIYSPDAYLGMYDEDNPADEDMKSEHEESERFYGEAEKNIKKNRHIRTALGKAVKRVGAQ